MAGLTFYFHTETTLNGAPAPPTNCLTASLSPPDKTDGAAASIAGGHTSTSGVAASSILVQPKAKALVEVVGASPPTTNPPNALHQLCWFTDVPITGSFDAGQWNFNIREDDNRAALVGNPIINVYANTTRDFASPIRFLFQLNFPPDWWSGATTNFNTSIQTTTFTLTAEYFIFQIWCQETSGFSSAKTHTFHQEGSDLAPNNMTWLKTPEFPSVKQYPNSFQYVKVGDGSGTGERIK